MVRNVPLRKAAYLLAIVVVLVVGALYAVLAGLVWGLPKL